MSNQDFIVGGAFVEITAQPVKNFRQDLKTKIDRSLARSSFKVNVTPTLDTRVLKRDLAKTKLTITVLPNMQQFRNELQKKLKTSTAGLTVKIPVVPVGGGTAAAGAAGAAGTGAGAAGVTGALQEQTQAERALTVQKKEDARITAQLAALNTAYAASIKEASPALAQNIGSIKSRSQLGRVEASLIHLESQLRKINTSEILAEDAALKRQVGDSLRDIEIRKARILSQREELAASSRLAAQQKLIARGASATGLSLLGIRGATLAASGAFLAGAAAVALFAKSVSNAASLESELNVFRVTAGATADEMERVRATAIALGRDITLPGVNAQQAAQAMTELARAGLSVQDAIAGARGVLQLATAANISIADATTLAANALNAFGLAGSDASRVADVLANAANAAQGSITDMGDALAQSAAVARQVGLSLEDTNTFLTALAQAGLKGSDAGTSLRTALIRLINPTKQAQEIFDKLGVSVRDARGDLRPDFFTNLGIALEGMSKKQRDASLAIIGGQDALRALAILSRLNIRQLIALRDELSKQGTAAEVAGARTAGLAGAAEALKNSLSTVGTNLGQGVTPALTHFTNELTGAVDAISQSEGVSKTLASTTEAMRLGFEALGEVLTTVGPSLLGIANVLNTVVTGVGVTEILALVAGFKLLPPVIGAAKGAVAALRAELAVTEAASIGFSAAQQASLIGTTTVVAALTRARLALAAFATSATGVSLAIAALAAGVIYLATRESDLEKIHRSLASSSDELVTSLSNLNAAQQAAASSSSDAKTAQIGVESAILAEIQARRQLAASNADKGSLERRQLENQLAIAIDNVRTAEARLTQARQRAASDAEVLQAQEDKRTRALSAQKQSILDNVDAIRAMQVLQKGGGTAEGIERQSLLAQKLAKDLREVAAANRDQATEESIQLAKRQELLARFSETVKRLPTKTEVDVIFNADTVAEAARNLVKLMGLTGTEAGNNFFNQFIAATRPAVPRIFGTMQNALSGLDALFHRIGAAAGGNLGDGIVDGAKKTLNARIGELQKSAQAAAGKATGLETQIDLSTISGGGDAQRRAILERIREQRQKALDDINRAIAIKPGGETPSLRKGRRDAIAALAQVIQEIKQIDDQMTSDAKQAAENAKSRREQRDQAILDALGVSPRVIKAENALTIAQATQGVADDIKATQTLLRISLQHEREIRKRIKTPSIRQGAIRDVNKQQFDLNQSLKDLRKQQAADRAQAIEDRRQAVRQSIQLNIDFAQTTGNKGLEIRARNRLIDNLQKEIDDLKKQKKLTLEQRNHLKELRNAIAEQRKALEDLKKEKDKASQAAAALAFSFLQSQQGFAANLLGNLIPGTAAGGLVGHVGPVGGVVGGVGQTQPVIPGGDILNKLGLTPAGVMSSASVAAPGTPSRGGQKAQTDILESILDVLNKIYRGTSHPEALHQRRTANGSQEIFHPF